MRAQDNAYCYGSLALEVEQPRFIVHEGGASAASKVAEAIEARHGLAVLAAAVLLAVAILGVGLLRDSMVRRDVAIALNSAPVAQRVVRDGDTLWSIAEGCRVNDVSTKDVVSWIEHENALDGGLIVAGQTLVVPQGALS